MFLIFLVSRILVLYSRELRFGLLKQRLLELVRLGDADAALNFAAERLAPEGARDPAMLRQIEEALTLLAYEVRRQSAALSYCCCCCFFWVLAARLVSCRRDEYFHIRLLSGNPKATPPD